MRLPNPLATRFGRLAAFFFLYLTEGIPLGFAANAIGTQLRRQGVGPAEIGAFVGSLYLPWAFKWAYGPFVDVIWFRRLGKRRGWILITQSMMILTILAAIAIRLPEQLGLLTAVILVHNVFGATQDVAIDALACNTLDPSERGLANGLMFAGASIGSMVGGAVLFLIPYFGFQPSFVFVAAAIFLVTLFVVVPMREPQPVESPDGRGSVARELHTFALGSFRSFLGSTGAFSGLFAALLPAGAMSLGLALQNNLGVELGLDDTKIGLLNSASAITAAVCCVLGGFLSDRLGRRRVLITTIVLMGVPVLYLANVLWQAGWIHPVDPTATSRPEPPTAVLTAFWVATLAYAAVNGLMYGTRSAAFMDVTNPAVAATQFTAYMALMNVSIAMSSTWQGVATEAWGYPRTMVVDVGLGLLCLLVVPLMRPNRTGTTSADRHAPSRARGLSIGLAVACFSWPAYSTWHDSMRALQPIAGSVYTLVFIGSAVFLLAGAATIARSAPRLARLAPLLAPFLLLMHARYYLAPIAGWLGVGPERFEQLAGPYFLVVPVLAGLLLLALATRPWRELTAPAAA